MISSRNGTYRWNLLWNLNILRNLRQAILERAFQIYILDLLAEICALIDESDQAIFNLQVNICALQDIFGKGANGFDREGLSTGIARSVPLSCFRAAITNEVRHTVLEDLG